MKRAHIMIELNNGTRIKYVRNVVADTNGVATKYYSYTGDAGDAYSDQTGAGKVKGDFLVLLANSQVDPSGTKYLAFPEDGGAVSYLSRPFYDQGLGRESFMINYIPLQAISRIYVVEEWMNVDQNL